MSRPCAKPQAGSELGAITLVEKCFGDAVVAKKAVREKSLRWKYVYSVWGVILRLLRLPSCTTGRPCWQLPIEDLVSASRKFAIIAGVRVYCMISDGLYRLMTGQYTRMMA